MADRFRLVHDQARRGAAERCMTAPDGWSVKFAEETRKEIQSAKFHAICGDAAKQAKWMGRMLSKDQWKVLFISAHAVATNIGADMVPGLEGEFVNIREASSQMSIARMASLIEYSLAWCADHDVVLSEPREMEPA